MNEIDKKPSIIEPNSIIQPPENGLPQKICDDKKRPERTKEEWIARERELLIKIVDLEKRNHSTESKSTELTADLKSKCEENEFLRAKLSTLETELRAVMKKPNTKNKDMIDKIKKQHEELLTKARGMIFEKTKMVKNQELQIEALTSQIDSMREVVTITKDLLNIRNAEVAHLQSRLECMELKIQAEKERQQLMAKKIESGMQLNAALKQEYSNQLILFKELKEKYELKFQAMENEKNLRAEASTSSQSQ